MFEPEVVRPARPGDGNQIRQLLRAENLEDAFVPGEFVVCEAGTRIVGCARAKRLPEGGTEVASLVVAPSHRGQGLARTLVTTILVGARHPVFILTLVPDLARRAGFESIPAAELPPSLHSKVSQCDGHARTWEAMRLRRLAPSPTEAGESMPDLFDT